MKTILLLICGSLVFAGCVTSTAPDGTTTSQTDAKAVKVITRSFAELALDVYLRSQGWEGPR